MNAAHYLSNRYDAVVVGTGAGGGTAGFRLASRGKRVLFVERGPLFDHRAVFQDERAMQIEKRAADNRIIDFGAMRDRAFIGGIAGGSTALYGACLLRPGQSDFSPGQYYGRYIDRSLWDWPVPYDTLAPFYAEAENLYAMAGLSGQAVPFLQRRSSAYPGVPLPLHPTNRMLQNHFRKLGLHPFVLPMGIDPRCCTRCPTCPGYICPHQARASSLDRCVAPAMADYHADLCTETEVVAVHTRGRRVTGLELCGRNGSFRVAADLLILAAGAIGTPVFLMQHGLTGGNANIGCNYMFHLGVIFVALRVRPTGAGESFLKQLGLTDYYIHRSGVPHKLGYIQQMPIPGVLTMAGQLPFPLPGRLLQMALARNITFAGAIEDLPQASNRVMVRGGGIAIRHRYHPYDIYRARLMRNSFGAVMRRIPASVSFSMIAGHEKLHTAHQVGTCRFGNDPRSSALDRDCRLHHMDNLYVADGSFMPTSLGVAPALTIIANALRVASLLS